MTAEREELSTAYVRKHFVNAMFTPGDASEVDYAEASEINEEQARFDAWLEAVRAEARRPRVIDTAEDALREPHGTYLRDSEGGLREKSNGWLRCLNRGWNNPGKHGSFTVLWEGGES